jgi:HlyD family secretion protein
MADEAAAATEAVLRVAGPEDIFPARSGWAMAGGAVLLVAFVLMVVLSAIMEYTVTVTAHANVRPAGELRVVQAARAGSVREILAVLDEALEKGQVIARIDDSRLRTQKRQLHGDIQKATLQIGQVAAEMAALQGQLDAEVALLGRALAQSRAELELAERAQRDRQLTTAADIDEARAAVDLARDELQRLQTLASKNLVARLQVKEKEAALKTAVARLQRVQAGLNPSGAEIRIARERLTQVQARGEAKLAELRKERELLLQREAGIQADLERGRSELQQVEREIGEAVIRAPAAGIVQELTLRNPGQMLEAGELVARIAPPKSRLEVKAFVALRDIGGVEVGQQVFMRVSACPFPDYGTLQGEVVAISPDAVNGDAQPGRPGRGSRSALPGPSYEVTVQPASLELLQSGRRCRIQAGMEGEARIVSREETILRFVLRKARLTIDL